MKTIVCMMMAMLCCWTSWAFADDVEVLPLQTQEFLELQTQMREMGIPEEPLQNVFSQMVRNNWSQQHMVQAGEAVKAAARAGLPTEPVISKALEGMAKQVPEPQVIEAMWAVQSRYAYSYQLTRSLVTEKKNVDAASLAVADSLAAGMKPEDIGHVKTQLQTRTQTRTGNRGEDEALTVRTMETMRTMAQLGIASSEVASIVSEALSDEYTSSDMKALGQRMASQASQESPAAIADSHADSIGKGDDDDRGTGSDSGSASGNAGSGSGSSGNSGGGSGSSGNSGGGSGSGNSGGGSGSSGGSGNSGSAGGNSGGDSGSSGSGSSGNSGGGSGNGGHR